MKRTYASAALGFMLLALARCGGSAEPSSKEKPAADASDEATAPGGTLDAAQLGPACDPEPCPRGQQCVHYGLVAAVDPGDLRWRT